MKYKRILYLLLTIALPLFSYGKDDTRTLFDKANQLYAKAHYKEALAMYQQIAKEGYQSAPLYFNMGNAYFRTEEIPSAILYYEKAHKLLPGDEDINFNIRFANQRTTDKVEETPEFFLTRWWKSVFLAFSLSALSVLSIVLVLLASASLIYYLFTQSVVLKKASFYASFLLLFLSLIFIFLASRQSAYFESHRQAIVFSTTVLVKSTPGDAGKTLFVIHEGTKVNVVETNAKRIKIKLINGAEGWIGLDDVKEI